LRFGDEGLESVQKLREVLGHGIPHTEKVNPIILMDQAIAHSDDLGPGEARVFGSKSRRDAVRGLSDYGDLTNYSGLGF
jgi:hypothetical protein